MRNGAIIGSLALILGCDGSFVEPSLATPPTSNLFEDDTVRIDLSGRCYARLQIAPPQTVSQMQQIEVIPAEIAPDGEIINPAVFRNETVQVETAPAQFSEFEMVCPPDLTPALITNLQRALAARALYSGPMTGIYDAATAEAVRQLQMSDPTSPRDSSILAVDTAADLGLVPLTSAQIDAL